MSNLANPIVTDGQTIAYRVASLTEAWDNDAQAWYLYYTMGADLAVKLEAYGPQGFTLGDPEITKFYSVGLPIHRRKIVPRDKGPSTEQALADADGENNFPRLMANQPVGYARQVDGQTWLVYCKGPHLRMLLDELWKMGKAVGLVEVKATDFDGSPLTYQGNQVYRRLIVPKEKGLNPSLA